MVTTRTAALVAAALLLAGCASNPKDIAASYVSPTPYLAMGCTALRNEAQVVAQRAAAAAGQQKQQQGRDAAAVTISALVFWPALFFVGGDKAPAAEIARLKGEMGAIEQANRAKNCGIQFQRAAG